MTSRANARRLAVALYVCAATVGIVAVITAQNPTVSQQSQTPVFKSRLDVIRVDVTVVTTGPASLSAA